MADSRKILGVSVKCFYCVMADAGRAEQGAGRSSGNNLAEIADKVIYVKNGTIEKVEQNFDPEKAEDLTW